MSDRLTKSEWLRHGLRMLASEGSGALKVGRMSEKLSVSRGSFYWHFRDIEDFRCQLLERWQEISTDQIITELDSRPGDPGRLKDLMHRAFNTQRNLDQLSGRGLPTTKTSPASLPPSMSEGSAASPDCWLKPASIASALPIAPPSFIGPFWDNPLLWTDATLPSRPARGQSSAVRLLLSRLGRARRRAREGLRRRLRERRRVLRQRQSGPDGLHMTAAG